MKTEQAGGKPLQRSCQVYYHAKPSVQSYMDALILCAGLGTRLRPHTDEIPKPLFKIGGRPLLEITIEYLARAGIGKIVVNTHHLHHVIEEYLAATSFPVPVISIHEPEILGTGGAIRNAYKLIDPGTFIVINGDIVTDIDLEKTISFHKSRRAPATLVLYDDKNQNSVVIDQDRYIIGFAGYGDEAMAAGENTRTLTFTGIQVLEPIVLDFISGSNFSSSIDAYRAMIKKGLPPMGYVAAKHEKWFDIGTPERFSAACIDSLFPEAYFNATGRRPGSNISIVPICGDGSDRKWYRASCDGRSLIISDHGIQSSPGITEFDSFVYIGRHLAQKGVCVPVIHLYDRFSGLVFVQDIGDCHLQTEIKCNLLVDEKKVIRRYRQVIDSAMELWFKGLQGFDGNWTYQTRAYDKKLIIEKECLYFVDAFLKGFAGMNIEGQQLVPLFSCLADRIMENAVQGLIHRDLQSRNIMIHNDSPYFIDFQGARPGPIQYDIASLIIDPYVNLPAGMRNEIEAYACFKAEIMFKANPSKFIAGLHYCMVSRLLQALGAFGFLSIQKGKSIFASYVPAALCNLSAVLDNLPDPWIKDLKRIIDKVSMGLDPEKLPVKSMRNKEIQ